MSLLTRALALGFLAAVLSSGAALGQTSSPAARSDLPDLPEPAEGTQHARFAVAGPVSPNDTRLILITPERSCGTFTDEQPWSAVHVAETVTDVVARIDVATLPDGTLCQSDQQIRVPIDLGAPLGERTIHDGGSPNDGLPLVNRIDGIDTGFRYQCSGFPARVVDLLGPGVDVSDRGITSRVADARAIVDNGDVVQFIGPLGPNGIVEEETWVFRDGAWMDFGGGRCRPEVVLSPGLHAATWTLRGPRPKPGDRRLRINVQGQQCHGKPPVGQITRPIIQVRPDSIVIILGTYFAPNQIPDGVASAGRDDGFAYIDCNGYGPVPLTIRLPVAIGTRTLYDGGIFPPQVRGSRR